MVDDNNNKRHFNYNIDIKPKIDFISFELSAEFIKSVENSLSDETKDRKAFAITLNDESKAAFVEETSKSNSIAEINIDYLTRRLNETIDNPFQSRVISEKILKQLEEIIGQDKIKEHFSFVASQVTKEYVKEKARQEESIFMKLLEDKKLVLAVSDDEESGFKVRDKDIITVNATPIRTNITRFLYIFTSQSVNLNNLEIINHENFNF
jgi:hypothetical protein